MDLNEEYYNKEKFDLLTKIDCLSDDYKAYEMVRNKIMFE